MRKQRFVSVKFQGWAWMRRFHISRHILWVALALLWAGSLTDGNAQTRPEVRLVLQITIDGLRADLINRYENGFGEGGFRYFLEKGTVFTNAHYQHANTETIVGHATLATGTFPSQHGMVGNVWFDREAGELAYNIEDPDHPIIATRENETQGEQVDPAQKKSRTQGRSPAVILAPTISDSLAAYYGGRSKIFGVSGKDRSAVSISIRTTSWRRPTRSDGSSVSMKLYVFSTGLTSTSMMKKLRRLKSILRGWNRPLPTH
jgi:hypothetical protein